MLYMGGKARIAKALAAVMLERSNASQIYIEPFCGAASVATKIAPHIPNVELSDISPDPNPIMEGSTGRLDTSLFALRGRIRTAAVRRA